MRHLRPIVEKYLEDEPRARERSAKDNAILNLLMRRYKTLNAVLESHAMPKALMVEILQEYSSMDRMWRKILEERPELRGRDYGKKKELEDQAKINLGYGPGYESDRRKLDTLN